MTGPNSRMMGSVTGENSRVASVSMLAGDSSDLMASLIDLKDQTQATCISLVNLDGQIILGTNDPVKIDPFVVGVLVASGMATALALTDAMDEDDVSTLHYYEGRNCSICAALLRGDMLVCLLFEEKDETLRLGNVWHYLKQGINSIRPLLPNGTESLESRPSGLAVTENGDRRHAPDGPGDNPSPQGQVTGPSLPRTSSGQGLLSFDEAVKLGIVKNLSHTSADSDTDEMAK